MSVKASTQAWAWIAGGEGGTAAEKLVLLRIADHVCDESKEAFPSTRHLSKMTGLGRATVQRAIKELDGRAFRAERRKSRYGDDAVTLYHWLLDGWSQDEATSSIEAAQDIEEGGPSMRPGVAPLRSQGGPTPQPEPLLNHHSKPPLPQDGGCGVGANAPENQKPIPKLDFPAGIPVGERLGLLKKLGGVDESTRADILDTLASKLARVAEGKSEAVVDIQAYAAGLIRRAKMNALDVPSQIVESRKNDETTAKIDELKAGLEKGGQLFVDGSAAEIESGSLVRLPEGCANLAQLISGGAAVEVRDA